MKKLFVLPILLLFSFCPVTAMKKEITNRKKGYFPKLKGMLKDSIGLFSTSCGHKLHAYWTPEEEKLDMNPIQYLKKNVHTLTKVMHYIHELPKRKEWEKIDAALNRISD